ncbi:G-protein coupled receptor Mth2 isoform X1 [Musca domestica]|uniref:G-protein coupled receptor Mth2 isoform X1 n=1 Tax=Musca domestica TaxID=7370 RepID=A0ABM3V9E0_MUSDO|nr:G-protein coupled receptor Mth2 isoform X1 [Musca domestica]
MHRLYHILLVSYASYNWAFAEPLISLKPRPLCNFDETANLTNAHRFSNGSYLYDNVIIPPEQVTIYDYIEVLGGQRIPYPPHPRGCVCQNGGCIKFCCHPTKQYLNSEGKCRRIEHEISNSFYVNVTSNKGGTMPRNAINDFIKLNGRPCQYPEALLPEMHKEDGWQILENGMLTLPHYGTVVSKGEYCLTLLRTTDGEWSLTAMVCPVPNVLSTWKRVSNWGVVFSTLCLILTVIVYLAIPELRGSIYGWFIISSLLSLVIGYTVLAIISLSEYTFPEMTCSLIGYVAYFFYESACIWLSVIGYHLWRSSVRNKETASVDLVKHGKRSYFQCFLFTYLLSFGLTFALVIIQNSNIPNDFKPGIGVEYCWLDVHIWAALPYFFALNGVICVCGIMFTYLAAKVEKTEMEKYNDLKPIVSEISDLNLSGRFAFVRDNRRMISNYSLLLLAFVIVWLLNILSYLGEMLSLDNGNPLLYTTDIANFIEGPLILFVLVIQTKVLFCPRR